MAEPSRLRHQLGAELRAARKLAGLNQQDVVSLLGVTQPNVSRLERGEGAVPSRPQVLAWLKACDARPEVAQRVLALLEAAHAETRPYPELLNGGPGHLQDDVRIQEHDARLVRNHQTTMIPGLLQTGEYARLLTPQADPTGQMDYAAAVAARMDRQRVLYQEGRRFEFLIAEHVLRWSPGPGVMPAQLDRLASLATLASVELAVLPTRREGALDWHSFVYTEPADGGPAVVTAELLGGWWSATDPATVDLYVSLWERLWKAAVHGDEAIDLILSRPTG